MANDLLAAEHKMSLIVLHPSCVSCSTLDELPMCIGARLYAFAMLHVYSSCVEPAIRGTFEKFDRSIDLRRQ